MSAFLREALALRDGCRSQRGPRREAEFGYEDWSYGADIESATTVNADGTWGAMHFPAPTADNPVPNWLDSAMGETKTVEQLQAEGFSLAGAQFKRRQMTSRNASFACKAAGGTALSAALIYAAGGRLAMLLAPAIALPIAFFTTWDTL